MAYRGGYLPETRRAHRARPARRARSAAWSPPTRSSSASTSASSTRWSAPATRARSPALWQRFGRAGRRGEASSRVLVASSAPLDQYLARDPEHLLGAPVEEARIDPDNVEILVQHLKCAAFELPFDERRGASASVAAERHARGARLPGASTGVVHECRHDGHACTTGRPTPIRPTTCRCAASAGTTS